jgi:hypothetical protein
MTLLNLDGSSGRKSGKSLKVLLGIGGLSAVIAVASTLAANININSGPVEFGQGVAQTTACDDSITITPESSFVNGISNSATFLIASISLSGIDSSAGKCSGKYFTIKAYDESSSTPLDFYQGSNSLVFFDSGNAFSTSQTGISVGFVDNSAVSINIINSTLNASRVYRLTVETSDTAVEEVVDLCQILGGEADPSICFVSTGVTINRSLTIPLGYELRLAGEFTITMNDSATITNNGTITSSGNVIMGGVLVNNGVLTNSQGEFNNGGGLFNTSNGQIYNYGIFPSNNQITNDGKIYNYGFLYAFYGIAGVSPCIFENVGYLELVSVCP